MFDATTKILEKSLDLRMKAHELRTSNVANANVPGYKARKIDFDQRLRAAIEGGADESTRVAAEEETKQLVDAVEPDVYEDPLAPMKGDGNTVNPETEQVEIAKNTIAYQAAIELINKRFALQKHVVEGR